MKDNPDIIEYEIICVIVNFGMGSKVLKIAKQIGVVVLGMGTVKNRILEFLALTDIRKEIVLMAANSANINISLENLDKEFDFEKPNHGIAFTMPLSKLFRIEQEDCLITRAGGKIMYNSIIVVVDRGKAEFVMDSATDAGAKGGTVIKARGSGIYETGKLFHMDIEPEKEIVMILSEVSHTEKIIASICGQLEIDEPGNGVIFCLDVNRTHGLHE